MAKLLYFLVFVPLFAHAQLFQLPFGEDKNAAQSPALEKSLTELEKLEVGVGFEEKYRQISLDIERQFDAKRAECSEVTQNKQRCFRDIVTGQKRYLERSFDLKKEYLKKLHEQQLGALDEAHAKALKEIERQF